MTTIRLNTPERQGHILRMISEAPLDKGLAVTIEPEKRSLEQNKLLHSLFRNIGDEIGYTAEEIKTVIKDDLGLYHDIQGKTKTFRVYDKTSKMNKDELSNLVEQVYLWAAQRGIVLE